MLHRISVRAGLFRTHNPLVLRSNPSGPTNIFRVLNNLQKLFLLCLRQCVRVDCESRWRIRMAKMILRHLYRNSQVLQQRGHGVAKCPWRR